jgi:hypothetical protein
MPYEAMDAGIEPGGLRDENEIKILICYLLKTSGRPMSFDVLSQALQRDGLVNYFGFAQSLKELASSGHVLCDAGGLYRVTQLGDETAATFERRLPLSVREKAVRAAAGMLERERLKAENKVNITKTGSGYTVECRVLYGGDELLALRALVPDMAQAKLMECRFLSAPEKVYSGALALLTGSSEQDENPGASGADAPEK